MYVDRQIKKERVLIDICRDLKDGREIYLNISPYTAYVMFDLGLFEEFARIVGAPLSPEEKKKRYLAHHYQLRLFDFNPAETEYGGTDVLPAECALLAAAMEEQIASNGQFMDDNVKADLQEVARFLLDSSTDPETKRVSFFPFEK